MRSHTNRSRLSGSVRRSAGASVVAASLVGAAAVAQTTMPTGAPPATQPGRVAVLAPPTTPTSQPSGTVTVDLSSPKAAVKTLAAAQVAGDQSAMKAVLLSDGANEQRMCTAMTEMAASIADFDRGLIGKFGPAETMKVMGDPAEILKENLDGIDHATEKVDGETATLSSNPSPQGTMTLKRVGGQWRVMVGDLAKAGSAEDVQKTLESAEKGTAAYRDLLAEVNAGKFATAEDARTALTAKMMALTGAAAPPAGVTGPGPATMPAK